MTVWFKQGVCGDLQAVAQKGLGKIAKFQSPNHLHVTSIRDGNHTPGSLHYIGMAFDLEYITHRDVKIYKKLLGSDWDVVGERTHVHCEYDPKAER